MIDWLAQSWTDADQVIFLCGVTILPLIVWLKRQLDAELQWEKDLDRRYTEQRGEVWDEEKFVPHGF